MADALSLWDMLETKESADFLERAALAALSGYAANPEIACRDDEELAALAWDVAEAMLCERAKRADVAASGEDDDG